MYVIIDTFTLPLDLSYGVFRTLTLRVWKGLMTNGTVAVLTNIWNPGAQSKP